MGRIAISVVLASAVGCGGPSASNAPPPPPASSPPPANANGSAAVPAGPAAPAPVLGTWRGTSICTVRPSACNDETVVLHISAGDAPDAFVVQANKVVNGQELDMGTLRCRIQPA